MVATSTPVECPASRHGDRTAARNGCKCPQALRARRVYEAARQAGRPWLVVDSPVDGTGSRRRIRALYAMGHREPDLAARLGYRGRSIPWMHRQQRISSRVAVRVRGLADELGMVAGPSHRLRARAASWGWVSMLAWEGVDIDDPNAKPELDAPEPADEVDEVAVERAVAGRLDASTLTPTELRLAVTRLQHRQVSTAESAARLGISQRRVQRFRGRARRFESEVVPA